MYALNVKKSKSVSKSLKIVWRVPKFLVIFYCIFTNSFYMKTFSSYPHFSYHLTNLKKISLPGMLVNSVLEVAKWNIGMFLLLLKIFMNFRRWDALVLKRFLQILYNCLFLPYIIHFHVKYLTLLSFWLLMRLINQGRTNFSAEQLPSSYKTGMCNLSLFILRTYCKIDSTSLKHKLFCFIFYFDETFLDCSNHEYYSPTKVSSNSNVKQKSRL